MPSSHAVQCVSAAVPMSVGLPRLPAGQALHVELSAAPRAELNFPKTHAAQPFVESLALVPPVSVRYRPISHDLHSDFPVSTLNCPALHSMHSVLSALLWYVPASQSLQELLPADVAYFPVPHPTQSYQLSLPAGDMGR